MCLPITHLSSPMGHHSAIYLYMCVLVRTWEFVFWWTPSTRIMSCRCYQPLVVFEPALTCWALRSFAQLVFVQGVQGIVALKEPCRNKPLPAHPFQATKESQFYSSDVHESLVVCASGRCFFLCGTWGDCAFARWDFILAMSTNRQ